MIDVLIKRGMFEHRGAEGRLSEDMWPQRQTQNDTPPHQGTSPKIARFHQKLGGERGATAETCPCRLLDSRFLASGPVRGLRSHCARLY